ncbi:hypothetical protein C2845_PM09G21940 [Panicum miliaceum]|uniref:Uncharacterized protein n=1 Tax=Panicum miliaceum TaxID=4540 RepID=A0A3L6S152_PANMI|nr:hypothetical protein C2845_PM09G21940 [Panicum miliaceum]
MISQQLAGRALRSRCERILCNTAWCSWVTDVWAQPHTLVTPHYCRGTTSDGTGAPCLGIEEAAGGFEADEDETEAAAAEEDRISALPEDSRLRIISLLPLESAIRTGALFTRWRAPSSINIPLRSDDAPEHLHWASLTSHLRRYLGHAAACDVEDLHIDFAEGFMGRFAFFSYQLDVQDVAMIHVHGRGREAG